MDYIALATEVALLFISVYVYLAYWKYKDFPPGPYGVPLLGYAPFIGSQPHMTLTKLSKKYGNTFSINLGGQQAVIVNDWKSIREVLIKQGDAFGARPFMFMFDMILQGKNNNITSTNGALTKELKRITLEIMRDCGVGRSSIESVVVDEVEKMATYLKTQDGKLVDMKAIFFIPIMNVIWGILSGNIFDINDKEMKSLADTLDTLTDLSNAGFVSSFPFLRYIAPELTGFTKFNNAAIKLNEHIEKAVDKHFEDENVDDNLQSDFMHKFIKRIKSRRKENNGQDTPPLCKNNLIGAVIDMFGAGVETLRSTMDWAFLLMAYHPEVQKKVQQELDEILDIDSQLAASSKSSIPYTKATMYEIQRFATVGAISIPHCAARDATLFGYKIPKGTTVITNVWALQHSEEYWGDPEVFRPERFLDEEGKLKKHDPLIPFSAGPRMCPGESLMKLEITLFFTCLMRRFSFLVDPNHPDKDTVLTHSAGTVLKPRPTSVIVKCR